MILRTARRLGSLVKRPYKLRKQAKWRSLRKHGNPVKAAGGPGVDILLYPQGQIAELVYTNRFEESERQLVSAYLRPGMRVIDVGANAGLYSILAAVRTGPSGQVWAFEPSSESRQLLERNLSLNGVAVQVFPLALSDTDGRKLILRREPGFRDGDRYLLGSNRSSSDLSSSMDQGDEEDVEVTTLDVWRSSIPHERARVDFLKMDIEGGEYAVFRGSSRLLEENPDLVIMFECTPQGCARAGHHQEDVFTYLRSLDFQLCCWNGRRHRWELESNAIAAAGNVWAARDVSALPTI